MKQMTGDRDLKVQMSYTAETQKCYTGSETIGERFFPGWIYQRNLLSRPFMRNARPTPQMNISKLINCSGPPRPI